MISFLLFTALTTTPLTLAKKPVTSAPKCFQKTAKKGAGSQRSIANCLLYHEGYYDAAGQVLCSETTPDTYEFVLHAGTRSEERIPLKAPEDPAAPCSKSATTTGSGLCLAALYPTPCPKKFNKKAAFCISVLENDSGQVVTEIVKPISLEKLRGRLPTGDVNGPKEECASE